MRWRIPITLMVAAVFAVACQEQGPTEVVADQALSEQGLVASHGQPGKLLKLKGAFTGGLSSQTFAPGFPATRDLFGGRCSVPSDWVIGFWATGNMPHVGKVTATLSHCSQIDFQTGTATYGDGYFTYVTANGDELSGTYHSGTSGPLSATEVWWQDTFVFDGGTGRFANASGGGSDWGTFNTATGLMEYETEGTISYDASDRRAD